MKHGKFIVLEGLDGAGKTTQVPKIAEFLRSQGIEVDTYRCPGGTPEGERIRDLIMDGKLTDLATIFCFLADFEQVTIKILESIKAGRWVICDRYVISFWAYEKEYYYHIIDFCLNSCGYDEPDLTLYFDISVELAMERMEQRGELSRFEKKGQRFFEQVYKQYFESLPEAERLRVIQAWKSEQEVTDEIITKLKAFFLDELTGG